MDTPVRRRLAWMAAGLMIFSGVGSGRAAEKAAPTARGQAALDRQVFSTLKEIHDRGATLHNNGDSAAAYRLFQGALLAVRPELAQQPDIQKIIDTGLAEAETHPRVEDRAMALHRVIEDVKDHLRATSQKVEPNPEPKPKVKPEPEPKPKVKPKPMPEPAPGPEIKPEEKESEEKKPEHRSEP